MKKEMKHWKKGILIDKEGRIAIFKYREYMKLIA